MAKIQTKNRAKKKHSIHLKKISKLFEIKLVTDKKN